MLRMMGCANGRSARHLLHSDCVVDEKTVVLQKKENEGFGFVLRGAKGRTFSSFILFHFVLLCDMISADISSNLHPTSPSMFMDSK